MQSVDHFVARTPWAVFGPLLAGVAVLLLLIGSWWAIRHRSAGVADAGQFARMTRGILSGVGWFVAATFSLTALLPCRPHPAHTALQLARGSSGLILLFVAALALASGGNASLQAAQAATADEHWRAGLLYFNRNDAALFVPKRIGWGYTLNMARPVAWLLMALTLGVCGLPLLLRHF